MPGRHAQELELHCLSCFLILSIWEGFQAEVGAFANFSLNADLCFLDSSSQASEISHCWGIGSFGALLLPNIVIDYFPKKGDVCRVESSF